MKRAIHIFTIWWYYYLHDDDTHMKSWHMLAFTWAIFMRETYYYVVVFAFAACLLYYVFFHMRWAKQSILPLLFLLWEHICFSFKAFFLCLLLHIAMALSFLLFSFSYMMMSVYIYYITCHILFSYSFHIAAAFIIYISYTYYGAFLFFSCHYIFSRDEEAFIKHIYKRHDAILHTYYIYFYACFSLHIYYSYAYYTLLLHIIAIFAAFHTYMTRAFIHIGYGLYSKSSSDQDSAAE